MLSKTFKFLAESFPALVISGCPFKLLRPNTSALSTRELLLQKTPLPGVKFQCAEYPFQVLDPTIMISGIVQYHQP